MEVSKRLMLLFLLLGLAQDRRDLEYAKGLKLDLYLPVEADAPYPVILWIHGGGWRGGSKERCGARDLTNRGFAVASINYRLSQEATFPAQIHDCKAAVRWLRANAKKYRLNPDKIGAWGASAGAHLAALLGTAGDVKDLEGDLGNPGVSSRVQAVCDWFGPTDFLQMNAHMRPGAGLDHDAEDSPESLLIGGAIQHNKEKVARANPITYVSRDDPPFLIMHGDRDAVVPSHQSEILHEALKKAGVDSTYHVVRGAGHGFGGPENMRKVEEFFNRHLK
jgi:acetyl esterase/lipase